MDRRKIFDFINKKIYPQLELEIALMYGTMKPVEIAKVVSEWRRDHGYPKEMAATVVDGFLFINGIAAGRIAPKHPTPAFSEGEYYWEGRILERQEVLEI